MMEKIYPFTQTEQEIFENIFTHEALLMNHVVVPPHKIFPKHPTDAEVYVLIAKGVLSLKLEDYETQCYKAGQLVYIPKHIDSELGNLSELPLELFVIKYNVDK